MPMQCAAWNQKETFSEGLKFQKNDAGRIWFYIQYGEHCALEHFAQLLADHPGFAEVS